MPEEEIMIKEKLEKMSARSAELSELMSSPEVLADPQRLTKLAREHNELQEVLLLYKKYSAIEKQIDDEREVIEADEDADLVELAQAELDDLETELESLEEEIKFQLIPKDPNDGKNAIVEIRAGTGGDEAGIFAGDLYRMYTRYCEINGLKTEVMNSNHAERGGFKEIIFNVLGDEAFGRLKFESGVHRVQRVPDTETQGRIHTSAASVVILPEAEDVEIDISANDLRIDVYRSSGPGGQSVNTTDSAVRITHIPTGMVVTCQDEKSQLKNKNKALKVLKARLYDQAMREKNSAIASQRKTMVGGGDRSAKIRTYNYPQGRVTDHRINLTLYKLDRIMEGDLDELIEALHLADRSEKLESAN
jgi:peptide chain release factor 1